MPSASLLQTFQPRNAAYQAASFSASVTFIEKWSARTVFQPVGANSAFHPGVLPQAAVDILVATGALALCEHPVQRNRRRSSSRKPRSLEQLTTRDRFPRSKLANSVVISSAMGHFSGGGHSDGLALIRLAVGFRWQIMPMGRPRGKNSHFIAQCGRGVRDAELGPMR